MTATPVAAGAKDPGRLGGWPRIVVALLVAVVLTLTVMREPDRPLAALVTRWATAPSMFVDVGGLRVHVRDAGPRDDPTPVVLVHGTSASLHTWEGWVKVLAAERRVISFDLPGFGLTGPNAKGDYRGDSYARFVLELLDALKVQRFAIGGNSLGGEVAWRTAAMAPARVAKLVLVDASGPAFEPLSMPLGFRLARVPMLNRLTEYLLPRSVVEASVRNVYGDPSRVTPELVDRYFELTLREGNRHALAQRFAQSGEPGERGREAEARIAQLSLPTLILWGERDRLIPVTVSDTFERVIKGSQLVRFPELGHVPQEEDPAASVQPVKAFLALP